MDRQRFHDFCINESVRIARFAARLYEAGQAERGKEMRQIADRLGRMANEPAVAA